MQLNKYNLAYDIIDLKVLFHYLNQEKFMIIRELWL